MRIWVVFLSKKMSFFWDFLESLAAGLWASEASSANKSRREAENAEAVYTQACISERRVGEADGPKRAKRARANSRLESRVGEAGGHQPVWVRDSFIVGSECGTTPPSQLWKWSEWVKWSEVIFGSLKILDLLFVVGNVLT